MEYGSSSPTNYAEVNRRLELLNGQLETENSKLQERVEELKADLDAVDRDNTELQALNRALQQVLDEKEVQVAAQQQYEVEFDSRVTAMLDERDRELAEVNREREMLILKVKVLQEELGLVRRAGGQESNQELTMLLKAKQLEIEDLEDRTEALEEEVARLRRGAVEQPGPSAPEGFIPGVTAITEGQVDQRLSAMKADAIYKETHIIDLERKLEEFAKGLGAEGILRQNHELEKQVQALRQQVADAKRDLSEYLSEAASIVYENDLLRSIANVSPDQLSLQEFKLKEKVTSAKAVALQKQLEREVYELEEERVKLKTRVRQMSELAAEKVSLLHDLQPEQMLQLEEIAASMRRGRLELPMTDETRQMKKEKEELQKKLNEKDRELAEHVDRKVNELVQHTGSAREFQTKISLLEKENTQLRQMSEDLQKNMFERVEQATLHAVQASGGQVPTGFMEHLQHMQSQMQAQMQQVQGMQVAPPARHDSPLHQQQRQLAMPRADLQQGFAAVGPTLMPRIQGMSPMAWSGALASAVQLPRQLSDGSPESLCFLFCQIIECVEELSREREARASLAQEVEVYGNKFDILLAEKEVLYKDYFKQRRSWESDRKQMEERIRKQHEIANALEKQLEIKQEENRKLNQALASSSDVSGGSQRLKAQLLDCLQRVSALEQNESMLARKCDNAEKDHALVKKAFDRLEKDFCERERHLKERLSKAVLWKQRAANALRVAQHKHQQMVSRIDFERIQLELQVSKRREVDLIRRQSELSVANAQKEDRLREMSELQERCSNLDNLIRECEQEFTIQRGRLQHYEPAFALECALFLRLVAQLQRALGQVGSWEAAAKVLVSAEKGPDGQDQLGLWTGVNRNEEVQLPSVEATIDERLRKLDGNNDGFITLGEARRLFESFGIAFTDTDLETFALAFHITLPMLAAPPLTPTGSAVHATPRVDVVSLSKASISVLGIVGRLRLYGLRNLDPESMFWAAVQNAMLTYQLDAQNMLRAGFQIFRTDGFIAAHDILHVLGKHQLGVDRLPARALRRVLAWFSADERTLEEVCPADAVPGIGDPREADLRGRFFAVKLIYHDFAERFEKSTKRALNLLRPPDASMGSNPAALADRTSGATSAPAGYLAEAREAAANRRCVILEQEVRMKSRSVRELQRQVNELEDLTQRFEQELHEERGQNVELKARLDSMLPRAEVEPKLRRLDELQFEVQQSRTALQHEKDMARVCAAQAENYEQLIKRRQQETRNLQNTVKMLQASDELKNTVGKLQYRLLLSQWEKGSMERQLQAAAQELRQARKTLTEMETEVESKEQVWQSQHQELLSKFEVTREMTEKYKEQATTCLPIDKARQLSSKLEQVATKKTQLEEKLQQVKRQVHINQSKMEEYRLQANQAKELLQEFTATTAGDDSGAPRRRLLEMASKVSEAKLLEMRHKRDLELVKEEQSHMTQARETDAKEIERLQKEVAHSETRLAQEEERWRLKLMEMQQMLVSSTAPAAAPGRIDLKKASQGTIESLEQLSEKLLQKDSKIDELQLQIEKKTKEMEATLEQERLKVRKLEVEISLTAEGDIGKLRQAMRAEHEAEMAQLSEAARESVSTLQALLDEADKQIKLHQEERDKVMAERRRAAMEHEEQMRVAQEDISRLRTQLIQGHMQIDGGGETFARLTPLSTMHLDTMTLDGSQFPETPHGGADAVVQEHLERQRQQVLGLEERLAVKEQEFRRAAQEHAEELRRREQGLLQELQHREHNLIGELHARDEERKRQFRSKEDEFRRLMQHHAAEADRFKAAHASSTTPENRALNEAQARKAEAALAQLQHQQAQWFELEMQQQQQQQAVSASLEVEIQRLRGENERLQAELGSERERGNQSTVRRQQQTFRKQLAGKQEQLDTMRKTIEALKDEVVRLTQAQERDKEDHLLAQRNEAEMRRRVQVQEDRMRQLKEQTLKLRQQLEDQKMMHAVEAEHENKHVQRQEALLEEAGEKLAECNFDAQRAEEMRQQEEQRAVAAEEQLLLQRLLLTNEAHVTKEDAHKAMEASDRRVSKLHSNIDTLESEKKSLQQQVQRQTALLEEANERLAACSQDAQRAEELRGKEEERAVAAEEQLLLQRLMDGNERQGVHDEARRALEAALEECKRKLEVESQNNQFREQKVVTLLEQMKERERTIDELRFDLGQSRSTVPHFEGKWAAMEEEIAALRSRASRHEANLKEKERQISALNSDREALMSRVQELQAAPGYAALPRAEGKPEPLHVLLSQGDGAPAVVKELRLEVRGTEKLRDRLYAAEAALEECKRKLEVDAPNHLAREQKKATMLMEQIEEKERVIAELRFDLRRARSAAGQPESQWAAREEELMALSTRAMRLEEDLAARRKQEAELEERLLEQEHENMELRFEREHSRNRLTRLENRILELEFLREAPANQADAIFPPYSAAAASAKTRKERNLEQVVEGLERVVTQLKMENQKLKNEGDGRREDRRYRLEADRLRKRVEALQEELNSRDPQQQGRQRGAKQARQARGGGGVTPSGGSLQRELEQKQSQIIALEDRIRLLSGGDRAEQMPHEVSLLEAELRKLRAAHEVDIAALDEAHEALRNAEVLEQRYREVAQENKRLRADLVALEDDGFWRDLEEMHRRNEQGVRLLKEAKGSITRIISSFPADPPSDLLMRIDQFVHAAAAAA